MPINKEELQVLINKFDRDIKIYPRWFRLLIATDQWFNVLIFNSSQDETISGYIGRKINGGRANKLDKAICWCLRKLQNKHCFKSEGE